MTKANVTNFFGVVRAFALALAVTGLVLVLGSFITQLLFPTPLGAVPWTLMPGAFGLIALWVGVLLALVCSLTRFLVARMTFASSAP
ncbi:MAG TPA: hypothetical protein VHE32_09600 [Rhodanobacteraceae bacterium]|nr:hypothetical protein [Rhodanobacteraceae bacterium]